MSLTLIKDKRYSKRLYNNNNYIIFVIIVSLRLRYIQSIIRLVSRVIYTILQLSEFVYNKYKDI